MARKWKWKTKANINTVANRTGFKNKTRIKESLEELEQLGFIKKVKGYYVLGKDLRVEEHARWNQTYYLIDNEILKELKDCTACERTVFLYLAMKATIDRDSWENRENRSGIYGIFQKKRGEKFWELLGISRQTWRSCLLRLDEKGMIAINGKTEIHVLLGRKSEWACRTRRGRETQRRGSKYKSRFYPKLSYMYDEPKDKIHRDNKTQYSTVKDPKPEVKTKKRPSIKRKNIYEERGKEIENSIRVCERLLASITDAKQRKEISKRIQSMKSEERKWSKYSNEM